jgi:PKD repeat protein
MNRREIIKMAGVAIGGERLVNKEYKRSPPDKVDPPLAHEVVWQPDRPDFSTPDSGLSWQPARPTFNSPTHREVWTKSPSQNPITGNRPTDPDSDGFYEDINGDGNFDLDDVNMFFNMYVSDEIQYLSENLAAFDFNNNGKIDIGDIQAMYEKL